MGILESFSSLGNLLNKHIMIIPYLMPCDSLLLTVHVNKAKNRISSTWSNFNIISLRNARYSTNEWKGMDLGLIANC